MQKRFIEHFGSGDFRYNRNGKKWRVSAYCPEPAIWFEAEDGEVFSCGESAPILDEFTEQE